MLENGCVLFKTINFERQNQKYASSANVGLLAAKINSV